MPRFSVQHVGCVIDPEYNEEIKLLTPAPGVNVNRKEYIPSAGWSTGDHGNVWMLCPCGICELQVSNEDHPVD